MLPDPLDKVIAALDNDHRKLYPQADFPQPVAIRLVLAPPTFYVPGPGGNPIELDDKDVDRQIQVSILEELRGLRQDLARFHGELYTQMVDVETAVQNSTR